MEELEQGSSLTDTESSQTTESSTPELGAKSSAPLDLDSVEKFQFQGKEWTPKELQSAYLMQSDYTRKTQEMAQERRYSENLRYDMDKVRDNPSLADQFKSIYPERFHAYLDYVLKKDSAQAPMTQGSAAPAIDPQFMAEFKEMKAEMQERKVAAIEAELDAKFKVLSSKYSFADEEAVLARAQSVLNRGDKLTDQVWDSLWKSVNERNQKLAEKYYSDKVKQQSGANQKGRDVASGGGTPGTAPKMPRTIKEAAEMARAELENT